MKLSGFISTHIEEILSEWDAFARTLYPAATGMTSLALRDHARQILQELTRDIETSQNAQEQIAKSQGLAPDTSEEESAAATHGTLRQISGFSLLQLTAEFRALRATVLRLWLPHLKDFTQATTDDMVRFNETIDQALAESVVTYSDRAARTRDTFLAILGHDLRSPLAAMSLAADYLCMPGVGNDGTAKVGLRIKRSATTMSTMVNDLLDYARTQFGGDMPCTPQPADMRLICQLALDDARAAHPNCEFELEAQGDLLGEFDNVRLQQLLSNLLNNAVQYRTKGTPVTVCASGEAQWITLQIINHGPAIPAAALQAIFDPMVQLSLDSHQANRPPTSLGLGLFIAREITEVHGGSISAESGNSTGIVFKVRLPRSQAHAQPDIPAALDV